LYEIDLAKEWGDNSNSAMILILTHPRPLSFDDDYQYENDLIEERGGLIFKFK